MKINFLKINGFGKIKNKEINLEKNINLIYGKNESGKSTLLKFIDGMLYGISKNKNGKDISDYDKYKPWNTEEFSGKINYTLDNGNKYEVIVREVVKEEIKVDKPSKLAARRKMFKTLNKVKDAQGNTIDLTEKLFNEIAPKYEAKGGYTRIVKLVARRGDAAEMAIIELI